jgi:hypothetical protein
MKVRISGHIISLNMKIQLKLETEGVTLSGKQTVKWFSLAILHTPLVIILIYYRHNSTGAILTGICNSRKLIALVKY